MKAVKGNKVYTVSEEGAKTYQQQGFDIYDEDGELLQYGAGKTVSYEEYARVKKELEEVKAGDTSSNQEDVLDILKCYAKEHGIDTGKSATVSGIVKKIKEHEPGRG